MSFTQIHGYWMILDPTPLCNGSSVDNLSFTMVENLTGGGWEWMGCWGLLGVAGIIFDNCGSFPHSLRLAVAQLRNSHVSTHSP